MYVHIQLESKVDPTNNYFIFFLLSSDDVLYLPYQAIGSIFPTSLLYSSLEAKLLLLPALRLCL